MEKLVVLYIGKDGEVVRMFLRSKSIEFTVDWGTQNIA